MLVLHRFVLSILLCLALAACESSEDRAARHLENGLRLVEEGDLDRAMVEFRNTLELQPANITAHRQMGEIHLAQNKRRGAYRSFLSVVEQQPEDLQGRIVLSNLAFQTRSWDEFARHGTRAVEIAPDDPEVKAIDLGLRYRDAVLKEDQDTRYELLAQAETLSGTLEDNNILRELRLDAYLARQDYENAILMIEQNIEENPDALDLRMAKVRMLSEIGDEAALEAELRDIVAQFPGEQEPQRILLRYLMSRERTADAEAFLREMVKTVPEDRRDDTYDDLIRFLLMTKGYEVALAELEARLAQEPDNDLLRAISASIKFDAGQRDQAVAEMEEILAKEPPNLTVAELQNVRLALARMLLGQQNEVGARKIVEQVLQEDPNAVGALKMQARWRIDEDDTDGAVNALRTALNEAPEDAEVMSLMAQAYQRAGNQDLARDFLSLAVETSNSAPEHALRFARFLVQDDKLKQAESVLIASLRLQPRNLEILGLLGQIYLEMDSIPQARQVMEALNQIEDPAAEELANNLRLEILGRSVGMDEALEFLENLAQKEDAEGNRAKLALIQARLRSGQQEEALDYSQQLVEENPDDMMFRRVLGMTHAAMRDYDAALDIFEDILAERPDMNTTWLHLSRVHAASGDMEAAARSIERGLEANPGDPDLLWGKASYLEDQGKIDDAIAIYGDLYQRFSSSPIIANNYASLISTYRDDPESLQEAEVIARRLRGTDVPAFQDTYGWILFRQGKVEEAVEYLEPAARGLENDEAVQYHLGMAYAALGRTEDARAQFRKALSIAGPLGSESPVMQKARAELDALDAQPDAQDESRNESQADAQPEAQPEAQPDAEDESQPESEQN